jgi:hypothetical protein
MFNRVKPFVLIWVCCLLAAGCATSNVQTRKQERLSAYTALSPEHREFVDQGKIKVGMSPDAIYIAWGAPSEVLENETAQGHTTIWIYHGQSVEETRYWTFREVPSNGTVFLERQLESDYFPRQYIRAEIIFQNGVVAQWRTLPRPGP